MSRSISSLAGALAVLLTASAAHAQGVPLGTPIPGSPLGTTLEGEKGPLEFAANQLTFARVAKARRARDDSLRGLFEEKGLPYPAPEIFLRVFKHERILELWARGSQDSAFTLVKEYPVCALPGQLGPKRRLGDVQVPEGFYFIDEFNPESAYHLSLRVNYPNLADRMRRQALALGGDIFIHGGCETVGCVPIENDNIEEVYWLAVQAMDAGQKLIPVHIFPTRLDPKRLAWLQTTFNPEADLLAFWKNLSDGYAYFEETHRVPWVVVDEDGLYAVHNRPELAGPPAGPPAGPAGDSASAAPGHRASAAPGKSAPAAAAGPPPAAPDSGAVAVPGGTGPRAEPADTTAGGGPPRTPAGDTVRARPGGRPPETPATPWPWP